MIKTIVEIISGQGPFVPSRGLN